MSFGLKKFIKGFVVDKSEFKFRLLFSKREEEAYRLQALRGVFSIIRRSENKHFLKPKHLQLFSELVFSESPVYRDTLGEIMLKNIYQRSKLLPPLISIIGLFLSDPQKSKTYREALIQVFKGMKLGALQQQDPNKLLMLQPESYTPYFIYVLAQLQLDGKMVFKLLASYLEALYKSHTDIDSNYLIYLLKQMKKYRIVTKNPKSEIKSEKIGTKNSFVFDEICEMMLDHIVNNYSNHETVENPQRKILMPSTYFLKKSDTTLTRLSSPLETLKNVEYESTPGTLKRKREISKPSISKRTPK